MCIIWWVCPALIQCEVHLITSTLYSSRTCVYKRICAYKRNVPNNTRVRYSLTLQGLPNTMWSSNTRFPILTHLLLRRTCQQWFYNSGSGGHSPNARPAVTLSTFYDSVHRGMAVNSCCGHVASIPTLCVSLYSKVLLHFNVSVNEAIVA